MRALLTTALALAFLGMAAITYIAVTQDPLAGEPRASVEVAPPNLAELQPKVAPVQAPAPVATVPAPAVVETTSVSPSVADTNAVALTETTQSATPAVVAKSAGDPARAAENAGAPAQPVAVVKMAPVAQPDPLLDNSVEGATVELP